MNKIIISTQDAPAAIGAYSQAVKVGGQVYVSGQIPLVPETGDLVSDDFSMQAKQVFDNLSAVAKAAESDLNNVVKLTVYLIDLNHFAELNKIMS